MCNLKVTDDLKLLKRRLSPWLTLHGSIDVPLISDLQCQLLPMARFCQALQISEDNNLITEPEVQGPAIHVTSSADWHQGPLK